MCLQILYFNFFFKIIAKIISGITLYSLLYYLQSVLKVGLYLFIGLTYKHRNSSSDYYLTRSMKISNVSYQTKRKL